MSDSNNSSFYKGLFFGALLGGLAGALLAPEDGKKNRETLRRKLDKAKKDFGPLLGDISKKITEINKEVGPVVEKMQQKIQQSAKEIQEKAGPAVDQAEAEVRQIAGKAEVKAREGLKSVEKVVEKAVSANPSLGKRARAPRFFKGAKKKK